MIPGARRSSKTASCRPRRIPRNGLEPNEAQSWLHDVAPGFLSRARWREAANRLRSTSVASCHSYRFFTNGCMEGRRPTSPPQSKISPMIRRDSWCARSSGRRPGRWHTAGAAGGTIATARQLLLGPTWLAPHCLMPRPLLRGRESSARARREIGSVAFRDRRLRRSRRPSRGCLPHGRARDERSLPRGHAAERAPRHSQPNRRGRPTRAPAPRRGAKRGSARECQSWGRARPWNPTNDANGARPRRVGSISARGHFTPRKYRSRNFTYASAAAIRFFLFRKPCPSSSKRRYSHGTPFFFTARRSRGSRPRARADRSSPGPRAAGGGSGRRRIVGICRGAPPPPPPDHPARA